MLRGELETRGWVGMPRHVIWEDALAVKHMWEVEREHQAIVRVVLGR